MNNAVIFDMDGVVSDTQHFHSAIESDILKRFDIIMPREEIAKRYAGVSDEKMFTEIFKKYNKHNNSIDEIIVEKWNLMKQATKGEIKEIPGVIKFIKLLKKNNYKLAIASASTKTFINEVLKTLKIQQKFDVVISSQEVTHGKPAPDIFLLALKKLKVKPKNAIVIEDGISGMIGAKKANIKCIGLVKNINRNYPADLTITSFDQLTISIINNLLSSNL